MMRAPLFFAICLALALALVGFGLSPLLNRPGAPVEPQASQSGSGLQFGLGELAQLGASDDVAVTAPPGINGALSGVAVAGLQPFDATTSTGARLLLGPQVRASLAGSPQRITLKILPLLDDEAWPRTAAVGFVVAGAPIAWVNQALPAASGGEPVAVSFTLPASDNPPLALAIHPSVAGEAKGFQIVALNIQATEVLTVAQ